MKHKALILSVFFLLFSLLAGFSAPTGGTVLADNLSEKAAAQLFVPYGSTSVFAYTDDVTHILKTDGSASCTTAYPASEFFLCGQSIVAVSPRAELTVAERFDADSLTRTDLIGLDLPANDILDLSADQFGRIYAVRNSEPDILNIFDEAGSYAGSISCPVNILGIQVLGDQLYIFLPEQCLRTDLGQALPQNYIGAFTYSSSAVPFRMFSASAYIGRDGIVYSTDGTSLTTAGHYALREPVLAAGNDALFWAGADSAVIRYSFSSGSADFLSLPGTAAALSDTAAVVRADDQYRLIQYGRFQPLNPTPSPTPTAVPAPTAAASASPTVKPTAAPSRTPSPTVPPTNTPSASLTPSASPSPTPAAIPGVTVTGSYMYVPVGTTAAALRNSLPYSEVEICTGSMAQASGKIRTGWIAVTPNAQYTLIVPGDVNSSGTVNSVDLRLMQQYILGSQMPDDIQILAGDLNKTGTPDAADLVLLVDLMQ